MRPIVVFGALPILIGCVTVPRTCEPLIPGNTKVVLFSGTCRKLYIRGEDYTPYCQSQILFYDPEKGRRSVVFFLEEPREILTFEGKPFSVDPKSKRFDIMVTRRDAHKTLGTETAETTEKGSCDLIPRDPKSFLIKCQSLDEKGKETYAEFATTETKPVPCREDLLKERPIGAF